MTRQTIFIIVGAFLFLALILGAWFWLFSKGSSVNNGVFGSAGNQTGTTTAQTGQNTNVQTNIPGGANTGSGNLGNTNVPLGPGGTSGPVGVGTVAPGSAGGVAVVPGVDWLGGSGLGGSSGAPTTNFTPAATNQLNDGTTGGQVTIFGTPSQPPDSSNNFGALFAAAGIGTALCTAGLLGGISGIAGTGVATAADVAAVPVRATGVVLQQGVSNTIQGSQAFKADFLDCIARTVGRAIVNQITASVINWINGGFKGSPSFVQNYQQFFANVANLAAGAYIQGSALSFLCSPFQLQIKLAIAQSYARGNGMGSCSLTQVSNNINSFINGNFSSGGWPALLSMTSVPTNNPYGALAYGQIGLATAQSQALQNANRNITPGGFISFAQTYDCTTASQNGQLINNSQLFLSPTQAASGVSVPGCKTRIATPGSVIESSLINTENGSSDMIRQLGISGSFDAILSALITQLMTKTLQGGLSGLSQGSSGYAGNFLTPDQQQAQAQGNSLLVTLQAAQQIATQYGQTEQGSISDIEAAQQKLANLSSCWESIATSESYSAGARSSAATNASSTQQAIAAYDAQIAVYNNNITRANAAIAALQTMQTQTLSITSTANVTTIQNEFNAAAASGQLLTQADVTQAQQDRTTLQSNLATQNSQTAANLAQCQATAPTQ